MELLLHKAGKKEQSLAERHSKALLAVNRASAKLQKQMGAAETRIPRLKRKLSDADFNCVKKGLEMCRSCKDAVLDTLKDLRSLPGVGPEAEECCDKLHGLAQTLSEHSETLQEAMHKFGQESSVVLKAEAPASEVAADEEQTAG